MPSTQALDRQFLYDTLASMSDTGADIMIEGTPSAEQLQKLGFFGRALWGAAESGDADAQYHIGHCYIFGGLGLAKDETSALKWYSKAAEAGNYHARSAIGNYYVYAKAGQEESRLEDLKWFRIVAALEDINAPIDIDDLMRKNPETREWCLKTAENGYASAQYTMGCFFDYGQGELKRNEPAAHDWYLKAAANGHSSAQYIIGRCYLRGLLGFVKDIAEAYTWFLKAAEKGHEDAQQRIYGMIYKNADVRAWYLKSAEQGYANAQYCVGRSYLSGSHGFTRDITKALKWFIKAAEQGNADAQHRIGMMFHPGGSTGRSFDEAYSWYFKAAEQGHADAQYRIGLYHLHGWTLANRMRERNYDLAYKWLLKAALQFHVLACNEIGDFYFYGRVVAKNLYKALEWHSLALTVLVNGDYISETHNENCPKEIIQYHISRIIRLLKKQIKSTATAEDLYAIGQAMQARYIENMARSDPDNDDYFMTEDGIAACGHQDLQCYARNPVEAIKWYYENFAAHAEDDHGNEVDTMDTIALLAQARRYYLMAARKGHLIAKKRNVWIAKHYRRELALYKLKLIREIFAERNTAQSTDPDS